MSRLAAILADQARHTRVFHLLPLVLPCAHANEIALPDWKYDDAEAATRAARDLWVFHDLEADQSKSIVLEQLRAMPHQDAAHYLREWAGELDLSNDLLNELWEWKVGEGVSLEGFVTAVASPKDFLSDGLEGDELASLRATSIDRDRLLALVAERILAFAGGERDETATIGDPAESGWIRRVVEEFAEDDEVSAFAIVEYDRIFMELTGADAAGLPELDFDSDRVAQTLFRCVNA